MKPYFTTTPTEFEYFGVNLIGVNDYQNCAEKLDDDVNGQYIKHLVSQQSSNFFEFEKDLAHSEYQLPFNLEPPKLYYKYSSIADRAPNPITKITLFFRKCNC